MESLGEMLTVGSWRYSQRAASTKAGPPSYLRGGLNALGCLFMNCQSLSNCLSMDMPSGLQRESRPREDALAQEAEAHSVSVSWQLGLIQLELFTLLSAQSW